MNFSFRKRAILLRRKGYSYNLIREQVPVSKSTLANWLGTIPYTPNVKVKARVAKRLLDFAMMNHKKKLASVKKIQQETESMFSKLSQRDLELFGFGIFLGEGSKSLSGLRVTNADCKVISTMILWFERVFRVPRRHFRLKLHLYPDSDEISAIAYWSRAIRISKKQFYISRIDRRLNKSPKNKRKVIYGTAHLYIKTEGKAQFGVHLHRRILHSLDAILKNFGIITQVSKWAGIV